MKFIYSVLLCTLTLLAPLCNVTAQEVLKVRNPYLQIRATATDPLYTTYTAAMERSRLYGDKGYKMNYYTSDRPISYESDKAGAFYNVWLINQLVIDRTAKFHQPPVVTASFPDMALLEYQPMEGIKVNETFFVYSSTIAIVDMVIQNTTTEKQDIVIYPIFELGNDSLKILAFNQQQQSYRTYRYETKKRLISDMRSFAPYPVNVRDHFTANLTPYSYGGYLGTLNDFYLKIKIDHYKDDDKYNDILNKQTSGYVDFIALHAKKQLQPGETWHVRYIKGYQDMSEDEAQLAAEIERMKVANLQPYVDANVSLYANIPQINFKTPAEKLVYLGALNLARGNMLPPEGKTKYNYYVFSRMPTWGWGHGHQVLHESISMIPYAYLDAKSAQESQRIYMEQQRADGLIAYRHGPRGLQDYPHYSRYTRDSMSTTSAPFFSWINYEIYKVSNDKQFLADAYQSGAKYVNWLIKNRDNDKDGLFEWGPYGIIENVRDWYNVVFQVSKERHLDVDKEDISDDLECLDLTAMVIKEMRSLAKMAEILGDKQGQQKWQKLADKTSDLLNKTMWDEVTGFYYNVDMSKHDFKYLTRDLKRMEIIGFLPLWAEAVPKDRVDRLVGHLTDSTKFWRKYGIPTVAADDEWYSPYVDYCCKWNGPVWLLWNYMVYQGLTQYGYTKEADELVQKLLLAVTTQLSVNHNYWESYSPDNEVLDSPSNYIWDAIMAKFLIDYYTQK